MRMGSCTSTSLRKRKSIDTSNISEGHHQQCRTKNACLDIGEDKASVNSKCNTSEKEITLRVRNQYLFEILISIFKLKLQYSL